MNLQQIIRYENAPAIEATWVDADGIVVRCHAYGNTQMDELRADLGADAAEHEAMIAEVEATQESNPPVEPVIPSLCTPAQGLVALFAVKGITEDDLHAAIELIEDPVQRYTARIGLARSTEWRRESPTMALLASLLDLTEADLDALFTYAVTVQV